MSALQILEDEFKIEIKFLVMKDVGLALEYLHTNVIVVGDVKPANILKDAGHQWLYELSDVGIGNQLSCLSHESMST